MSDEASVLASEAYVFGFPLVANLERCIRFTTGGVGDLAPVPFNAFGHARRLADPGYAFVSVNNDTLYSVAIVDLSVGPLILTVPSATDRYHVLGFVDAWTNNFAYLGTRSTGGVGGDYLLVPPHWSREGHGDGAAASSSTAVIRFPTTVGVIVGKWELHGDEDPAEVHALQNALALHPASEDTAAPTGIPAIPQSDDEALDFFEKLRVWSQAFPPSEIDAVALATYESLGLTSQTPIAQAPPELQDALRSGYADGKDALESAVRSGQGPLVSSWTLDLHAFDYNLDFFELGTIRAAEWMHDDPSTRYAVRAAAARVGLWGTHGYETAYALAYTDAEGERLTGEHAYCIRLHPTPPGGAFWSLTMYDLPEFQLVENPIHRYSIGGRTRGIVYDDDGGLTITMSAARPTDARDAANWLPTPAGPFRPILRLYEPGPEILEGLYEVPPIERVG